MAHALDPAPPAEPLSPAKLRWSCDPGSFAFRDTSEVEPIREIIGQDRALRAITLGLEMKSPGYNIFLTGFVGTGRNTTIRTVLERIDRGEEPPPDLCYVHNFSRRDRPRALFVPAGRGRLLVRRMEELVRHLERDIPRVFLDEPYRKRRERIAERFRERQHALIADFEKKVEAEGLALVQVQMGSVANPQVVPAVKGEPTFLSDVEEMVEEGKLSKEEFDALRKKVKRYAKELQDIVREAMKIESEMNARFAEHDTEAVRPVVHTCVGMIREDFRERPDVLAWLDEVEEHARRNHREFTADEDGDSESEEREPERRHYVVNLVVDNSATRGAPVVVENTPSISQLFGILERTLSRDGDEPIDHTKIKAGSLHAANGGYLVLNATDLFSESPWVWNALKRTLRTGRLEIPSIDFATVLGPPSLKPESVCVEVKVVLIGDVHVYSLLHAYDDDFRKIFKVRADFDTEMDNAPDNRQLYAGFVQRIVEEEKLLPFEAGGVARVAEHGSRLAGRRNKLSTRFNMIADLVRESGYFADKSGAAAVATEHVARALEEREYRNSLAMEKMQELIDEGTIFIDVAGREIGEVNGLAVYEAGEHAFGLPSKITASVSLGNAGIINIEREAELSGRTHDKGVQILAGYLRSKYAQERPLTLSASICFEQSYHGVDGDSASSTELYAILSALADVPLRQEIAVTGSVNQKGEIQPIGGVNEKIEGFFEICGKKGLTGTQGVLIPAANVEDLMLRGDVVDAVAAGRFSIWAVATIDEGIGILTGVAAGDRRGRRRYPPNTVNGRVDARLRRMAGLMREYGGHS